MNQRLRESKAKFEAEQREAGRVDGAKWAADEAEFEDLHNLSREFESAESVTVDEVCQAIGTDVETIFGDGSERLTESYVTGFVQAAIETMQTVE